MLSFQKIRFGLPSVLTRYFSLNPNKLCLIGSLISTEGENYVLTAMILQLCFIAVQKKFSQKIRSLETTVFAFCCDFNGHIFIKT